MEFSVHTKPANEIGVEGLPSDDPVAIFQERYAIGYYGGEFIYLKDSEGNPIPAMGNVDLPDWR